MNATEKFQEALQAAVADAVAAGVERGVIDRVLCTAAGLDPAACREAVDAIDDLIDAEQDELAEQLTPARDLLRRAVG